MLGLKLNHVSKRGHRSAGFKYGLYDFVHLIIRTKMSNIAADTKNEDNTDFI